MPLLFVGLPEFSAPDLLLKKCCSRQNITCFRKLSLDDIECVRQIFGSFCSETSQTQYVIDYLRRHCDASGSARSVLYSVAGKVVCQHCWRLAHGIKYTRFKMILKKFEAGLIIVEHGRKGVRGPRNATLRANVWLHSFVKRVGDHMPTDGTIHLPSCLTKSDVYELACEDLTDGNIPMCSRSTFFSMWSKDFKHVKIPPVCQSFFVFPYCTI